MYRSTSRINFVSVSLAVVLFLGGSLAAQDRGPRGRGEKEEDESAPTQRFELDSWGQLGRAVKGADGWFELTFYEKDKKGKPRPLKGFLHLSEESKLYADVRVPVEKLEEGKSALLFGKPVDRQVPGRGGVRGGRDSQIQNCQVIIAGQIDQYTVMNRKLAHPKYPDLKWCSVAVTKTTGGLEVTLDNASSRVTMASKSAPTLVRTEVELAKIKGKPYIQIMGKKSAERPASGSAKDAEKPCFEAKAVVLLDRRYIKTVYPLFWER